MEAQRKKTAVAALSVASNSVLVLGKLLVGCLIGSVSVISEAIHSGMDLAAAVIALVAVRTAARPADGDHPYGHGKIENLSGVIEALLIFLAAGWIIMEAVKKLQHHAPLEAPGWGIAVMGVSAGVNLLVSHLLFKVGKATDSMALQADGWHLRTDVWTSLGVMGGLLVIAVGRRVAPGVNLAWVDPVAALLVAALILKAAWALTAAAGRDLLDTGLPGDEEGRIRAAVPAEDPRICSLHHLRTRKAGAERFVEFHLVVTRGLSVEAAHDMTDEITAAIRQRFPRCQVTIHVEPCALERCPPGATQCRLTPGEPVP